VQRRGVFKCCGLRMSERYLKKCEATRGPRPKLFRILIRVEIGTQNRVDRNDDCCSGTDAAQDLIG
jgi:hypothetical protein